MIEKLPPDPGFGKCGGFYTEGVGEYFCVWNGEKKPVTEEICEKCPYDKTMTRTEAIEKMAKAISKAFLDENGNSQGTTDKELAEAALNALLGE